MSTEGDLTHSRWMELFNDTLRPLAHEQNCGFFKSTGDGAVVQFPTAAQAFGWAQAVQRAAIASDVAATVPLALRVGIDCGDLRVTGEDIYGVAVNVAARLQEIGHRAASR